MTPEPRVAEASGLRLKPGRPYPLGATWDGLGVNFAIFSEHAERVELCLFDSPDATAESRRVELPEQTDQVWHGYLPGIRPGQLYGYRVHGPYEPAEGHRFNPAKVLLDPYAKAIGRITRWGDEMFGYRSGARTRTCRSTTATTPPWRPWRPWSTTPSPGATIDRPPSRGTGRSSTRCT